jgi:prefoldin subunit 5
MMEQHLVYNLQQYKKKIPEIEKTLNAINRLKAAKGDDKELDLNYSLADNVWAKAHIVPEDKVYLWLGANVMLEYCYDDAWEILNANLIKATEKSDETRNDLSFLKDQITTSEVNIARVYNHSVLMRRQSKPTGGQTEKK